MVYSNSEFASLSQGMTEYKLTGTTQMVYDTIVGKYFLLYYYTV